MCLIFTDTPNDTALSDAWLLDFYDRNSDGWGFMWYDGQRVQVHKQLGTDQEWLASYRKMRSLGVGFVTHLRMRTHGATDLENTHPYEVQDNLYIMHNGILSSGYGSSGDVTKSDTWHYIRDTLHPLLGCIPISALFSAPIATLVGNSIGNNRFVLLGEGGAMSIVNKQQGVMWHGRWMSNTYAWTHDLTALPDSGPLVSKYSLSRPNHIADTIGKWAYQGSYPGRNSMDDFPIGSFLDDYDDEPVGRVNSNTPHTPSLWEDPTANYPKRMVEAEEEWWCLYDNTIQKLSEDEGSKFADIVDTLVTAIVSKHPRLPHTTDAVDVLECVAALDLDSLVDVYEQLRLGTRLSDLLCEIGAVSYESL